MFEDLVIPLVTIAIAEFGDKTQISILLLSSKTPKHLQIFLGVLLAFILADGIAIALGSWITTIIPFLYLKLVSGAIFIMYGVYTFIHKEEDEKKSKSYTQPFISAFFLIFLTEWGDKTQIVAALFATTYSPYLVFIGTITALALLSGTAIIFGKMISNKLQRKTLDFIAGIVFIILGISFLLL
ncbi:MAG: TMEM165/GDT1 family protein [Candidatus Thermoplasmatota archaeon]|nr:TMEM165/GDT1 family protein [Candidatus Thermoplasmatota archaeon]MBU1940960.1 TMEM165/GDT1 family protein [Candidatus Thermoplasmatota archaeon]